MHLTTLTHYLWQAAQSTLSQLVLLLGPGLALAFVMHLLSGFIARRTCRLIGRSAFLALFGWLGTMVHEGGHALFCLLFGHRITAIKWFDCSCRDGSYGYVRHSYDPDSLYQHSGRFFIGIGPLLLGTAVIYYSARILLGTELLVPLNQNTAAALLTANTSFAALATALGQSCLNLLTTLFTARNLTSWQLYLFLYLSFSVGSAITLSPQDIKGTWSGFVVLTGLLLAFNVGTSWLGSVPDSIFRVLGSSCSVFYAAMLLAVFMNAMIAALLLLVPAANPD